MKNDVTIQRFDWSRWHMLFVRSCFIHPTHCAINFPLCARMNKDYSRMLIIIVSPPSSPPLLSHFRIKQEIPIIIFFLVCFNAPIFCWFFYCRTNKFTFIFPDSCCLCFDLFSLQQLSLNEFLFQCDQGIWVVHEATYQQHYDMVALTKSDLGWKAARKFSARCELICM